YHPEYRNTLSIPDFPRSYRTIYVGQEAALYPPLYYLLDLPFYNLAYDYNLVDRVELARFLSLVLGLGLAVAAYKIGRMVWPDKIMASALAVLVSFQPMISFVAAGIHPDNLLNFFSTLIIIVCLLVIKNGVKFKYLFWLVLLAFLGWQTKPSVIFLLPVAAAVVAWRWHGWPPAFLVLVVPAAAFFFRWPLPYMPYVGPDSPLANMDFGQYLAFRIPKLTFELWPWYWGVFKWLGITLPPLVMKIITRVAILAAIGLVIYFYRVFRAKKFTLEFKFLVFFLLSSFFYLLYLVLWDWRLMQSIGFSQGLQGRYLFPNVVPQMALLLAGLTVVKRFEKTAAILLVIGMVILNIVALHTVYVSY
ncbi:DUF2142 domain-containing protein, partial [Candidatus Microgenomates bacterium]|nr:DUF2142 domain-containing protein [Candidatus Microgenomates bacterium]